MSEDAFLPVKQGLRHNALAVCQLLLPGGVKDGQRWRCGGVDGAKGESLAVYLPEGSWKDFATGETGDLIDLWAASRSVELLDARDEAAEWLGLATKRNGTDHAKPAQLVIRNEQQNVTPIDAKQERRPPPSREPDQVWNYLDHEGTLAFRAARWNYDDGGKTVLPQHWNGKAFVTGLPAKYKGPSPAKQPLLYRSQLFKPPMIVFVEGEKTCDAVWEAGYVATTNQGGSQNLDKQEWAMLNGANVVIWRDNDDAGETWQQKLLEILPVEARPRNIVTVKIPADFEPKWDAADVSIERRQAIIAEALQVLDPPPSPTNAFVRCAQTMGQLADEPIAEQKWLVEGVLPAGVPSMWASEGDIGKSFLSLDLAAKVALPSNDIRRAERFLDASINHSGRVILFSLEDNFNTVRSRLRDVYGQANEKIIGDRFICLSAQDIIKTDPNFSAAFIERDPSTGTHHITDTFRAFRDLCLQTPDLELIIIDPLYAVVPGNITDTGALAKLTNELTALATKTNAALLVINHLTKINPQNPMKSKSDLRQLVSGAAQLVNAMRMCSVLVRSKQYRLPGEDIVEFVPVKCNLKHRDERRLLMRDKSTGLLVDRTSFIRAELDSKQQALLRKFATIAAQRAEKGKPFHIGTRSGKSAFKQKQYLPEDLRALTASQIEEIEQKALQTDLLVTCAGSRNQTWLDIAEGPVAMGITVV